MLVTIDTLRADHVGSYGADFARTPVFDRVAAEGTRFDAAISPAPLTLVSHATLLTGLDPPEHGVRHNGAFALEEDIPTLAEALRGAGFATGGFVGAFVLDRRFGLARGFDSYDDRTSRPASGGNLAGFAERSADAVVGAALEWLESAPGRFFVWIHLYDPHFEYRAPAGFAAGFPSRPYDAEIAFADSQVGRLLDAVAARWPDGRTLVAITSDHGESLGEHGEPTHSHFVYEATQHVPLALRGPGIPAGGSVPDVVGLRDVAPTILDALGLAPLAGASGRSLLPLARGRRLEPVPALVETLSIQLDWGWSPLLGLRTAERKYIRAPRPELYDLAADPGELRNLAVERSEEAAALDAELTRRLAAARPVVPNLELGDADRARLEALGYVAAGPALRGELGVVGGPDPKDEIATVDIVGRADALLVQHRHEEALALLEPIARDSLLIRILLSKAYLGVGDGTRGEAAARAALALAPESTPARQQVVEALAAQERFDEARAFLAAAMAGREPGAALLADAADLERLLGERDRAETLYARALAAPGAPPEVALELAALRLEAGREAAAEALLRESPPAVSALLAAPTRRLSRALAARGRGAEALERLRLAAEAGPGDGETRLLLADLLEREGHAEEARQLRASVIDGVDRQLEVARPGAGSPYLHFLRAQAAFALGRAAEAEASLARALEREQALDVEIRREARALAGASGERLGRLP